MPVIILKGTLPIIRCTCGASILLLPDLKAMNKAIENHLAQHKELSREFSLQLKGTDKTRKFLLHQLFDLVAETCDHGNVI